MSDHNNEQKEYEEFIKKFIKAGIDINDEVNKLLRRFKSEVKNILPISFAKLFEMVNN